MADSDPRHDIAEDILRRVATSPRAAGRFKITSQVWVWAGFEPISRQIAERWLVNNFFDQLEGNIFEINQRGRDFLDGEIPDRELVWPDMTPWQPPAGLFTEQGDVEPKSWQTSPGKSGAGKKTTSKAPPAERGLRPDLKTSDGEDGRALFSPSGNCRLCGQNCSHFGWISHAKSRHMDKGDPVTIVVRNKKKVAVIVDPSQAVADDADSNIATGGSGGGGKTERIRQQTQPAKPITIEGDISTMSADEILVQVLGKGKK